MVSNINIYPTYTHSGQFYVRERLPSIHLLYQHSGHSVSGHIIPPPNCCPREYTIRVRAALLTPLVATTPAENAFFGAGHQNGFWCRHQTGGPPAWCRNQMGAPPEVPGGPPEDLRARFRHQNRRNSGRPGTKKPHFLPAWSPLSQIPYLG